MKYWKIKHFFQKKQKQNKKPYLLCELDGGSAWKGPGCPLANVRRDLFFIFIAQEVKREAHGGEIEFLQQAMKQIK